MKKIFSILFAVLLLFVSIIPSYAANPVISINTVSSASVGDTITVSVNLSSNVGLGGIGFTVTYNTTEFQLVSGSVQVTNLLMADTNIGTGSIRYAGVSANTVTSGILMTFKLKVLKTGGKIFLTVNDAVNDANERVTVNTSNATVKCSHADMKWTVTKQATCAVKGEKKGICACGYTTTEIIAKTEHSYGGWSVEKQPTETRTGLKVSKCSVCGDRREQVIPAITTNVTTKPSGVTTTKPTGTTKPVENTTTSDATTNPSKETTTVQSEITTTKPEAELTVTTTEQSTESVTDATTGTEKNTTTVEDLSDSITEEQETKPTDKTEKEASTVEIVAKTVGVVLGVEALGLAIFLIVKKKKENK